MKFVCIALVALLAVASAGFYTDEEYQYLFTKWATEHNKQYHHDAFFNRFQIFKANLDKIALHNMGNHSYSMDMNDFGDLTFEEFHAQYTGYRPTVNPFIRSLNAPDLSEDEAPQSIDWRAKNAVTGVKNQQQCGSCWAFSATGSIEGIHAISSQKLVSVSEQQLMDCSGPQGNQGCNGGLMDNSFEYVIKEGGLCTEESYPYTATDGTCKTSCKKEVTITGYKDVPQGDEKALLVAVAKQPVSVAIEADRSVFQFYSGGILDDSSCGTQLDHGVLVVGYGTESDKDFWIIKNSWGASWGEKGYIRLIRGKNQCGLTLAASYPTL